MNKIFIACLLAATAIAGAYYYTSQSDTVSGLTKAADTGNSTISAGSNSEKTADNSEVDESALRYFAMKGDKTRLQAEIQRLKALYPDWTPPEDPLAPVQIRDVKLDQLWQLFTDGQYAELRKAITARKIQEPEWVVPVDLLAKLNLAEERQRLINASDNKQYDMVVNLAAQSPQLLTCQEVDVLWRLAEAFAKQEKPERARDGYLYVLRNCNEPAERLVTVQKALEILPYDLAQQVLAEQKTNTDGKGEFDPLKDEIARHFVSAAAQNPDMQIDKPYLAVLETSAEKDGNADDAEMLGWYYLRRNDMSAAEKWFRIAQSKTDNATIAQGLALILNKSGDFAQAENIMYKWRDQSPEASAVYFAATANLLASDPPERMPAAIPQDVMTRIAAAVIAAKNVSTAEQLGWYARIIGQNQTAIQWFRTALDWDNSNEPAAYGLAVSLFTIGDTAGVNAVKQVWAALSQRIAEVGTAQDRHSRIAAPAMLAPVADASQGVARQPQPQAVMRQRQPQAYEAPPRQQAAPRSRPAQTSGTAQASNTANCRDTIAGPLPTGGNAVAHGWCLMEINRPLEAAKSFESALNTGSAPERSDAAYGQSLAYLRLGLIDKAAVSAIKAPMTQARQKELRISILSDRAVAAYQAGQFRDSLLLLQQRSQLAPPRKDLMALQAASYLKLSRFNDARVLYEALAATGDREGFLGLAAIQDMTGNN